MAEKMLQVVGRTPRHLLELVGKYLLKVSKIDTTAVSIDLCTSVFIVDLWSLPMESGIFAFDFE